MKKTVLFVCTLVLIGSLGFADATENRQKIYSVDSDVFEAITYLYIDQGFALPSTTGPWSAAELLFMLERINPSQLSASMKEAYNYATETLQQQPKILSKGIDFSWNFDANLESYVHTNTEDFLGRDTWIRGFMDQKPLLSISLETWPADNFYGYSEFTIGNNKTLTVNEFGSTSIASNLIVLPPAVLSDLDFNMPYRAFVAAGGDHWTFQLGRDRMNWGAGTSGNLMLGDNLAYHNMGKFTTFGEKYKYTFVTSFFPHASSYMDSDPPTEGDSQFTAIDGINLFMAHRLEWRMFRDKIGITVTESVMYQSEENVFDLRFLNPAAIFHNYYIRANANSLLGLEVDYSPIKGLNIYGQAVVDEFSLPGEPIPSETEKNYPPSFGYLAGARYVTSIRDLIGTASIEFAYTDPFLYLRDMQTPDASTTNTPTYHLNHVGVIREFTTEETNYHADFLGYQYGPDAIVINVNGGVKDFGKWHVDLNGFYMIHGTHDIYTAWSNIGFNTGVPHDVSTPTTDHLTVNYNDSDAQAERDSASQTLVIGASGSYQIMKGLSTFGQLDYININNYGNIQGQKVHDVQLTLGISYSL